MEILFITHKYPPSIGGMEKQSYELTQRMQQHTGCHLLHWKASESKFRFFWTLKKRIRKQLRQHPGITLLHFNDGLAAAFCSGKNDFPGYVRTVTLHGLDVVFPNSIFQRYILPRFNRFQSIIAVSRATADACIQRGMHADKIVVIPNGVDHNIATFEPDEQAKRVFEEKYRPLLSGKKNLLLLGRPVLRKGFSWFIRSVLPLLPANYQVVIIGPYRTNHSLSDLLLHCLPSPIQKQVSLLFGMPTDENNLRQLLKSPGIRERVLHLGKLPFTDILQIMTACTAFMMPNIPVAGDMEGFGLVALEANLRTLPVFAAHLEGITAAIQDQKNGCLVPTQSVSGWLKALSILEKDPTWGHNFGCQAKQYTLENFSWEKMTSAYFTHFTKLRV
jgi:glycosyltransferase involved in cell wall biosynthesis